MWTQRITADAAQPHSSLLEPSCPVSPTAQARTHGTAQLMLPSGGPGQAYDESTLMRVLAHRPERNGSKMLKTLYKLGKRIK